MKIENSLRELRDSIKSENIHIIGSPEEEKREKGEKNLSEEMWHHRKTTKYIML